MDDFPCFTFFLFGKYDTYKGSTHIKKIFSKYCHVVGNMILIEGDLN